MGYVPPEVIQINGQLALNPSALLFWLYEMDLNELPPQERPRFQRFQQRVDARLEALSLPAGPSVEQLGGVLQGMVDLTEVGTRLQRGGCEAALAYILSEGIAC